MSGLNRRTNPPMRMSTALASIGVMALVVSVFVIGASLAAQNGARPGRGPRRAHGHTCRCRNAIGVYGGSEGRGTDGAETNDVR